MAGAPQRLRCEYITNPLGVTNQRPRFSWWISDPRPAEIQSAYEILVASDAALLARDEGDLWHSGQVHSNANAHVVYQGKPLSPGQAACWKVRTFDSDGLTSPWSEVAHLQLGLEQQASWPGYWMSTPLAGSRSHPGQAVAMRREFETEQVQAAYLYVAALGAYDVAVNGVRLTASGAAPVWSDYQRDIYYQTFDVGDLIRPGPNAVGLLLADGYFCGELAQVGRCAYGSKPKIRCLLALTKENGDVELIQSDHRWHWQSSWILAAEVNAGEDVDLRQYPAGWDAPNFDESAWSVVDLDTEPAGPYLSQPFTTPVMASLVRPQQSPVPARPEPIQPQAVMGDDAVVFDFGTVLVGRVQLRMRTRHSDDVRINYSLTADFEQASVDTCTTQGGADGFKEEIFASRFALHSFRYLRVVYTRGRTEITDVAAHRFVYPQSQGLNFKADHSTLNELVDVLNNSIDSVALSVPMRGVSRSRRLPDVAYARTWLPRLAEDERAHGLILKWLADISTALDAQAAGDVPASPYIPSLSQFQHPDFADEMACYETFVHTLWSLYRHQDDVQVLQQYYAHIRVGALAYRHCSSALLRHAPYQALYGSGTMATLVATCESFSALKLAARIASVLGHLGDYELIDQLAGDVRKAWRHRYVTPSGHVAGDNQSVYVAALYHQMLEQHERAAASERLIELLEDCGYHADVVPGVVRALLPTLTDIGRLDLAYMVLLQTSQPSWLGHVNAGHNLIGRVPGDFDIADIGLLEWLVQSVVGLRVDPDYSLDRNGYRSVRIEPHPPFGQQFLAGSPVTQVEARLQTLQGVFALEWQIQQNGFALEVVIPPGCIATVVMPDGIEQEARSGRHKYFMDFDAGGDGVPMLVDVG